MRKVNDNILFALLMALSEREKALKTSKYYSCIKSIKFKPLERLQFPKVSQ